MTRELRVGFASPYRIRCLGAILLNLAPLILSADERPLPPQDKKPPAGKAITDDRKTPREPEWLSVQEPQVDSLYLEFATDEELPDGGVSKGLRKQSAICLRAAFPRHAQVERIVGALPEILAENRRPKIQPDELLELFDYEIERQEQTKSDARPWKSISWKKLDTQHSVDVLFTAQEFEAETAHPGECSNIITSPLPRIRNEKWDERVLHPRLKENKLPARAELPGVKAQEERRFLLFRFFDFDVKDGTAYRYRIRITFRNPAYEEHEVPPSLAKGETRQGPWSDASPAVTVNTPTRDP